jgi:nucleotide-binding universal stress UspA family protein
MPQVQGPGAVLQVPPVVHDPFSGKGDPHGGAPLSRRKTKQERDAQMKLLVGYDGSNSAKAALELACSHAKAFNAGIEIVTSLEGGSVIEAIEIEHANEDLEYARALVEKQDVPVNTHLLVRGMRPGEDIVAFASEKDIDTIFIGIRRRSKVGKLLFGSNAQYIILKAPCPVMTIR